MAVLAPPVGVATHLAEVGASSSCLRRPSGARASTIASGAPCPLCPDAGYDVVEPEAGELGADLREVVAAVEMERFDLAEQSRVQPDR